MNTIINKNTKSFKEFEKNIFNIICLIGESLTSYILEKWDDEINENRDKKKYRNKGLRKTSIKTIYGEVTYRRRVYETEDGEGKNKYVYLLDEEMQVGKIGLISSNLAEKIVNAATENSYRAASELITETSGQSISAGGVWNLIQKIGQKIGEEEEGDVSLMKGNQTEGKEGIPVLFEEMDGVWLKMQDSHHKKTKKHEMKVFTMYKGWDEAKEKAGKSALVGKIMLAGMDDSRDFHEKKEACIRKHYDADEIEQRVLGGDGGPWIRDPYDDEVIYQLDRFHIQQEIIRQIKDKEARTEIRRRLDEGKPDDMLDYIKAYADSKAGSDENDTCSKNAMKLYSYLKNNYNGLLPYQKQGRKIPESPDGIIYKNMGVQENQNCTVITLRMKHRRMRWSVKGADNLAKVLYKKENNELRECVDRYLDKVVIGVDLKEALKEALSAARAPKKDGKGNSYLDALRGHMQLIDSAMTPSRKAMLRAILD